MSKQRVYIKSEDFQPRSEFLLVKPIELKSEEKTESGLIISLGTNRSSFERPTAGKVISLGNNIDFLKEDMTVFWPNTDGIDFEFDDGSFILLKQQSILGSKK